MKRAEAGRPRSIYVEIPVNATGRGDAARISIARSTSQIAERTRMVRRQPGWPDRLGDASISHCSPALSCIYREGSIRTLRKGRLTPLPGLRKLSRYGVC
jgi:hypothetical protein